MSPVGIALAFWLFGVVIGLGVFLLVSNLRTILTLAQAHNPSQTAQKAWVYVAKESPMLVVNAFLVAVGSALVLAGMVSAYAVVFR